MKKKSFVLRSQLEPAIVEGEVFTKPSLAEPGQALTAQEILENFLLTGRTGIHDSVYDESGDLEDCAYMDKVELEDYKQRVSQRSKEYFDKLDTPEPTPEPSST